jgi:hypothetical protein
MREATFGWLFLWPGASNPDEMLAAADSCRQSRHKLTFFYLKLLIYDFKKLPLHSKNKGGFR